MEVFVSPKRMIVHEYTVKIKPLDSFELEPQGKGTRVNVGIMKSI